MAPNVYINGNPARDSATARNLEQAMSDMQVTNPLSGKTEHVFVAMADPVEEKLLHMVTADPARTPTFTPFAQGTTSSTRPSARQRRAPTTTCRTASSCPNTAPPNQTFAWNHGGIQPEIRDDLGRLGRPGRREEAARDRKLWTDHTDMRPTMLALLGLKDDYVSDGRVLTEFLKGDALPKSLEKHKATVEKLGACLQADQRVLRAVLDGHARRPRPGALASNSAGDTTYDDTENGARSPRGSP